MCHCGHADPGPLRRGTGGTRPRDARPARGRERAPPGAQSFPRHRRPKERLLKLSPLRPAETELPALDSPAAAAAQRRSPGKLPQRRAAPGGRRPGEPAGSRERAARSLRSRRAGTRLPAEAARPGSARRVFPKLAPRWAGPGPAGARTRLRRGQGCPPLPSLTPSRRRPGLNCAAAPGSHSPPSPTATAERG